MCRNIGVKWFSFLRDFLVLKIIECHSYSFSKCLIIYLFNLQFNALFEKLLLKYFAPFFLDWRWFLMIRKILMTVLFFCTCVAFGMDSLIGLWAFDDERTWWTDVLVFLLFINLLLISLKLVKLGKYASTKNQANNRIVKAKRLLKWGLNCT